jgi:hypothetical protein
MNKAYDLMTQLFRVSESEFYVRLDDVIENQIREMEVVKERMIKSQMDNSETLVQLDKVLKELRQLKECSWREWENQKQF